jgi:hypothetical protein
MGLSEQDRGKRLRDKLGKLNHLAEVRANDFAHTQTEPSTEERIYLTAVAG